MRNADIIGGFLLTEEKQMTRDTVTIQNQATLLPAVYSCANLPADAYHASPGASKSLLDAVARSPLHLLHALTEARAEPTPAQMLGSAAHAYILEPARYSAEYVIEPVFRGKGSVAARAEWKLANADKVAISEPDAELVRGMGEAITRHDVARELLSDCAPEVSVFWCDFEHDAICRIRIDAAPRDDRPYIVDLKTAADASYEAFARAVHNFRYHVSAAMYLDGARHASRGVERYYFVVVENKPPHAVAVYELDNEYANIGRILYRRDLAAFVLATETGEFPGYAEGIRQLTPPAFATRVGIK
jgi:exodeoxyribonuclease VIII